MEMTVTEFKAKCLGIIDHVSREKARVTLTRHGKPTAELVPISTSTPGKLFGRSKKTTLIKGDLNTTEDAWNAED